MTSNKKYKLRIPMKTKLLIILGICLFFLCLLLFMKPYYSVYYEGFIIKTNYLNIPVDSNSDLPEIKASYLGLNFTPLVQIDSNVNLSKVGEYNFTYEIKGTLLNNKKTLIVNVVDTISPIINLNGEVNSTVMCESSNYTEEGYTAVDNYDGDLTNSVQKDIQEDKIIYTVTDSSGNNTSVVRFINTIDNEGPQINLKGFQNTYVKLNDNYDEQGLEITDNCDNNITSYDTSGSVDTSKVGVYTITYSVKDSHGNESKVVRNVYVYDPLTSANLNGSDAGVIYLTFDDGPSEYTSQILDILNKYNIKATFFVTGKGSDDLIKREYDEGHTVGIHTFTHQWSIYTSEDTFFEDLNNVKTRVQTITGYTPTIMRFAGGSSNTISKKYHKGIMTILTSEVLQKGYHYFDWNVSIEDAGVCAYKKSYKEKQNCITNYFQNGLSKSRSNVVLMHDVKSYTKDSLENMIGYALQNGYTFAKITMDTEAIHQRINN